MTSLAKPWAARSTILARMTSRYGDVYLRALSASSLRSAPVNSTTYGLRRGIGTSVRECARPERDNATKIRHRIYEQEHLACSLLAGICDLDPSPRSLPLPNRPRDAPRAPSAVRKASHGLSQR